MKLDKARTGIIEARYLTTSPSLVYIYPHTFLTATEIMATTSPCVTARNITTRTASCAARGLPAPNSFETLVLWNPKMDRAGGQKDLSVYWIKDWKVEIALLRVEMSL